jgi:hypothetical protein
LNGKETISSDVFGANENIAVPVNLHTGWNPVLVKVDRTKMQKAFFALDVRSKSGEAIQELKFDFAADSPKELSRAVPQQP